MESKNNYEHVNFSTRIQPILQISSQVTRYKDEKEEEASFTSEDDKFSAADDDGQAKGKGKGKDCCNFNNCFKKLWFLKDLDSQRSC